MTGPARWRRVLAAWRRWRRGASAERDLHDEIQGYAEMLADEGAARGVPPAEARRRALAVLGSVAAVEESVRQGRAGAAFEQAARDARYGLRALRRTPGFTMAAVLTLALGLGVNTAVFSVVDVTLLMPLPYRDPDRLVAFGHLTRAGTPDEVTVFGMSADEIAFWRAQPDIFDGVESYDSRPVERVDGDSGTQVGESRFSAGLPALLGVVPEIGRPFTEDEGATNAPVALISDRYWRRRFGGRPDVLGAPIRIESDVLTIVGVLPPAFRYGPDNGGTTDVWRPLAGRDTGDVVFRLRPPLTRATAIPALQAAAVRLQAIQPAAQAWTPELEPFAHYRDSAAERLGSPLWVIFTLTGLVVLVVCANLANLLRVRFLGRREELAMRTALGASRGRVARLLFIEGALVVLLGGIGGAAVAGLLVQLVPALVPAGLTRSLFLAGTPALDGRAALFFVSTLALVALLAILLPAIRGARLRSRSGSPAAIRQTSGPGTRRRALVFLQTFQMGLALVLVTVSALVADSFIRLKTADLGYDADELSGIAMTLPVARYGDAAAERSWFARAIERVSGLPGIEAAAFGDPPPRKANVFLNRVDAGLNEGLAAATRHAGVGYFEAAGIDVLEGRVFVPSDASAAEHVVVMSDSAARRLWPSESAVGQLVRVSFSRQRPPARVIGVVRNIAAFDYPAGKPAYAVYVPLGQDKTPSTTLLIRARPAHGAVLGQVRDILRGEEPDVVLGTAGPVTSIYEQLGTYDTSRFYAVLVAIFAVLALVTAAVGLYGLIAYVVGQRRREIGVRVALGSTAGRVRALVLTDAIRPLAGGLALGWIVSWILTRYVASILYGVAPRDPVAFLTSGLILVLAALAAVLAPVRRATGVDPIQALRVE